MEKEELDKMEDALRNTTAGQFAELEKAIHQCAASLDDTTVCAIGIIKKVSILISLLLALITLCLI